MNKKKTKTKQGCKWYSPFWAITTKYHFNRPQAHTQWQQCCPHCTLAAVLVYPDKGYFNLQPGKFNETYPQKHCTRYCLKDMMLCEFLQKPLRWNVINISVGGKKSNYMVSSPHPCLYNFYLNFWANFYHLSTPQADWAGNRHRELVYLAANCDRFSNGDSPWRHSGAGSRGSHCLAFAVPARGQHTEKQQQLNHQKGFSTENAERVQREPLLH